MNQRSYQSNGRNTSSHQNKRRKRNRRRKPNNSNSIVNSSQPSVSSTRYLKQPSFIGNVLVKTVGQIVLATSPFVICEARLMDPNNAGMSGGTGVLTTIATGLLDFSPYALGRITHVTTKIRLSSFENTQVLHAVAFFSDTQPSTVITTYGLALSACTNYLQSRQVILGTVSGQSKSSPMTLSSTTRRIVRDPIVSDDRDFVCTLNPAPAAPNQELWLGLVVFNSITTINIANGCAIDLETTLSMKGFSRLPTA